MHDALLPLHVRAASRMPVTSEDMVDTAPRATIGKGISLNLNSWDGYLGLEKYRKTRFTKKSVYIFASRVLPVCDCYFFIVSYIGCLRVM